MMSRLCKYIIFVFFLAMVIDQKIIVSAEEVAAEMKIARPVVTYESNKLRDPFKSYLIKEVIKDELPENGEPDKPKLDLSKLKVQGIVWGVKTPQAIINNKILMIGDLIDGAEIVNIEKSGVTLSFAGAEFVLTVSRQDSVKADETK